MSEYDEEVARHVAAIGDALPDVTLLERWKAINSLLDYRLANRSDLVATMLVDLILERIADTVRSLIPREELEQLLSTVELR
jgi:hypothetical protein